MTTMLAVTLPLLVLLAGAALVVVLHRLAPADERAVVWLGAIVAVTAGVVASAGPTAAGGDLLAHDPRGTLFASLVCAATGLALLAVMPQVLAARLAAAHLVALVLVAAAGAVAVVLARDLVVVLGASVVVWMSLSALARLLAVDDAGRGPARVAGALAIGAVALLAAGTALIFGGAGRTGVVAVAGDDPLTSAGLALVLVGLAAAFVPIPFAPFGALVPAVAAYAVLIRLGDVISIGPGALDWRVTLAVFAAATIALPTLAALVDRSLRRLVALAVTAQLGYATAALAAGIGAAPAGAAALLLAVVTGVAGYAALSWVGPEVEIADLRGLARRAPLTTAALAVVVLAAAGVPATAGFVSRAYVLEATTPQLAWLAIAVVLASAAWAVIALRVVASALRDGAGKWQPGDGVSRGVLVALAIALVVFGLIPGPLFDLAQRAGQ